MPTKKNPPAIQHLENEKMKKSDEACEKNKIKFIPLAFDTLGASSIRTQEIIKRIASLAAPRKQISISQSIAAAWQKISTTLAKQVANQVLARQQIIP